MESASIRRKWANWKFRLVHLDEHDENAAVTVELDLPHVTVPTFCSRWSASDNPVHLRGLSR